MDILCSICIDATCGWACKTTAAKAAAANGVTGDQAERAKALLSASPLQCSVDPSPKQQQMVERESKATLAKTEHAEKCPRMHWDGKDTITVTPASDAAAVWIEQRTTRGTTLFGFRDYARDDASSEASGMVTVRMDDVVAFKAPHVKAIPLTIYYQKYLVAAYAHYDDDKQTYVSYMSYGSSADQCCKKAGEAKST